MLTDLDELVLSVRDGLSKKYMAEAILAYRMGAQRLATVGVWTAAAYDILEKIRELKTQGDPQATGLIDHFDRQVENNNVAALLAIERKLVDDAEVLGFVSAHDARLLRRLQEDRNLCAHPAFSQDNELVAPTPESVRAHIVHTIESLLAMPPISGKAIINHFANDLPSAAFPRDEERAVSYVAESYLKRMRASVKRNFAIVLLKGVILGAPPAWNTFHASIIHALKSVERDDPAAFREQYLPEAGKLTEGADENGLFATIRLLRAFPKLRDYLALSTTSRIHAIISSGAKNDDVFHAIGLLGDEIDKIIVERLRSLPEADARDILVGNPDRLFIVPVWTAVSAARNYRTGEARLYNASLLANLMSGPDFAALVSIVAENIQVLHASGSPGHMTTIAEVAIARGIVKDADWSAFYNHADYYQSAYEDLWRVLREAKVFDAPLKRQAAEELF
jgi:hypothetical protein